ncbi:helix-turn-helix domain-containing protein [Rhizobium sp. C4]|uniref:helix-turn-helix domain-containing protein n=1 Tax=Rhizobium sp. C4 TaxID=1349800 RepID=UPI003FA6EBCE
MRGDHLHFGSDRARQNVFGRRGDAPPVARPADQPVFGKRGDTPADQVSLQRERLRGFASELQLVFGDADIPIAPLPFVLEDDGDPTIVFAPSALLYLDHGTGAFVFVDESGESSSTLISADTDRIMGAVLSYLAKTRDAAEPSFHLSIVSRCVGHSIAEIERGLILATLRHCHGNRTFAARQLGISLRTLRTKLRSYWSHFPSPTAANPGSAAAEIREPEKCRASTDRQQKIPFPSGAAFPTAVSRLNRED